MRTQARLGAPRRDAAQGPQHARRTEQQHARSPWEGRRQAVQDHRRVVEDVGREPVHFALGFERGAELVREEDGGDAAGRFLEDGEEERGGGRGEGVADADAWRAPEGKGS